MICVLLLISLLKPNVIKATLSFKIQNSTLLKQWSIAPSLTWSSRTQHWYKETQRQEDEDRDFQVMPLKTDNLYWNACWSLGTDHEAQHKQTVPPKAALTACTEFRILKSTLISPWPLNSCCLNHHYLFYSRYLPCPILLQATVNLPLPKIRYFENVYIYHT